MTILDQVLAELSSTNRPVRSGELAAKVGVTESALAGMITVLVAKGRLTGSKPAHETDIVTCSEMACSNVCVGLDACPFITDVPETYLLVARSLTVDGHERTPRLGC